MLKEDEKLDLVGHLEELRVRIIRCFLYIAVGFAVGWALYPRIYDLLMAPLTRAVRAAHGQIMLRMITEGFITRFQVSGVAGIIIALPFILWEVWAFVAPGLTRTERRAAAPLLPVAMTLFAGGVAMAYLVTPRFAKWMLSPAFVPHGTRVLLNMQGQIALLAKLYLAFGLCFQLPIVMTFLIKAGVVSPDFIAARRREAIIAILVIAAVVTPTWDIFTLAMLSVPMYLLFEGTIWFARFTERRQQAAQRAAQQAHDATTPSA